MFHSTADVLDALPGFADATARACSWLTDIAQIKTRQLPPGDFHHAKHTDDWRGAFFGEYHVASKQWNFMCPTWHGGQAIKALALASVALNKPSLIDSAKLSAAFIHRNQRHDGPDAGLILAYEDHATKVNTSAVLETLDGLFVLAEITGDLTYRDMAISAGRWAVSKAWVKGQGIVLDLYDPASQQFIDPAYRTLSHHPGRPLADDAIWLTCYQHTGEDVFRQAFYDVLDCLLRTENPQGNWAGYGPCLEKSQQIHPRHAFWWGLPMLNAWYESHDQKYLDAACRSGLWYINAQRSDGGMFRYTDAQFKTACFGHATSGSACAVILWLELWQATQDTKWLKPIALAMQYIQSMQFIKPADKNLTGCILEKVLPPNGSDDNPYQIRDLASIFFVQAAAKLMLANAKQSLSRSSAQTTIDGG